MLESLLTSSPLQKLISGIFILSLILLITRRLNSERKIRRLGGHAPAIKTWLPLGADFIWRAIANSDEALLFWDRNMGKYGRPASQTMELNAGGNRVVMTSDPENIKAILATQFDSFGKGEDFNRDWHEFLGDSIFSTDHEKWQQSRQLIRPQFVKDRVSDLFIFEEHCSTLLGLLGGKGETVDVKDLFFRFTLDSATHFLLGRSVDSLKTSETHFADAFAEIQRVQNMIARAGPLNFLIPRRKFRKHLQTLNNFVEPYIVEALALSPSELEERTKSDHGYTFLHALAAYTRDRTVLRDQLVAVLLAGRDTTAGTLTWLFYELGKNADVVSKLRREIGEVVGWDSPPTYEHLKSMKYLQNTISETLRLYPAVPFNVRLALRDTTLPHGGGPTGTSPIGILKDTPIAYCTHHLHLTRSHYPSPRTSLPSPAVFAPERWAEWQPKPWTYIPFNGGPRLCVGQQFALTEMGYTVVRILQKFARVESRMRETGMGGVGGKGGKGGKEGVGAGAAGDEKPSLAQEMRALRPDIVMKSEIVISPAGPVELAFYEI